MLGVFAFGIFDILLRNLLLEVVFAAIEFVRFFWNKFKRNFGSVGVGTVVCMMLNGDRLH